MFCPRMLHVTINLNYADKGGRVQQSEQKRKPSWIHLLKTGVRTEPEPAASWPPWTHFPLRPELGDLCWLRFETLSPGGWMLTSLFSAHKHQALACLWGEPDFIPWHGGGVVLQPLLSEMLMVNPDYRSSGLRGVGSLGGRRGGAVASAGS